MYRIFTALWIHHISLFRNILLSNNILYLHDSLVFTIERDIKNQNNF